MLNYKKCFKCIKSTFCSWLCCSGQSFAAWTVTFIKWHSFLYWLQLCFESLWTCVFIYFLQVQWRLNWFSLGDWVSRFRIFNFFILKNCVVSHCLSVNSAPVGSGASELSSPLSCGPGSKVFSVIIIGGFIDVMHFVVKLSWLNLLFIMNLVFDIILRRFMTLLNTEFTWW